MLSNNKTYANNNLRDVQKTFNDGVCTIYGAYERELGKCKGKFCFAYESVGVLHFFQAQQNNIQIDKSISIQLNDISVDPQDVVNINGTWYRVIRIQYHDNKKPNYWTLSLSRSEFEYEVENDY